jgi:MFS family permease
MKDNPDINKIWQEAAKQIEETNKLTRSIIIKSIESKSQDVMSQFIREKKAGLIGGILFIPIIIVGFLYSFSINLWSILFSMIVFIALIYGVYDGLVQLKKIRIMDQSDSLFESLTGKTNYLKNQLKRARIISPLVGVGLYLPLILIYLYLEYGDLHLHRIDILVLMFSTLIIILITRLITWIQTRKYLAPLEECLYELNHLEPPSLNTRPKINLAVILTLLLALSMVIYWFVSKS